MFLIQEKEEPRNAEECAQCLEDFDIIGGYGMYSNMCDHCDEKIKTTFSCPNCHKTYSFFNKKAPTYCESCKLLLPDIRDLIDSQTKRINYHLKKDTI